MSVSVQCARCLTTYAVSETKAGKRGRCRKCGEVFVVPKADPASSSESAMAEVSTFRRVDAQKPGSAAAIWRSILHATSRDASRLEGESLCLVALSVADLLMTYFLLRQGGSFYESNPVAHWFFARWNIAGMAMFKFGIIGSVIVLGEVIERKRPGWGRAVLGLGCAAAAIVVCYSVRLFLLHEI
jgi:predicted Zn finger-like uncharacterized protein